MQSKILTYSEIDREEWGRLVRESATGTWFQTPEAYDFFASMPKLFKPFVIGAYSRLILRGVCVGYVTKEKNPLKQFFTRRAIILGGPCLADDATDEEVEELMKAVRKQASLRLSPEGKSVTAQNPSSKGCLRSSLCSLLLGRDGVGSPIYIETRNFNDYSRWKGAFEKAGFSYQPHLNFHVDCTDKDKIWERLSENRKRQIRKQPTQTLPIGKAYRIAQSEEEIREWYGILENLYKTKVKTPLWPVEFFIEAYRQGVGRFMLVRHEGKIIGGSMVVALMNERMNAEGKDVRGVVYEWFECGMNGEYKEQYPSVMATYAGIQYAAEHGCARYDMMGAGEPGVPYGVRDFKAEFGGTMVEHGRFIAIEHPLLYRIGAMGVKIMKGRKG